MAVVIVTEAVRQDEIPKFVSLGAVFTAFAFALGPLVGGAITSRASWRWVFWIKYKSNLPSAPCADPVLACHLAVYLCWPS